MPFFDSAIQFLGFDGRRNCESLWRCQNGQFERCLWARSIEFNTIWAAYQ